MVRSGEYDAAFLTGRARRRARDVAGGGESCRRVDVFIEATDRSAVDPPFGAECRRYHGRRGCCRSRWKVSQR